MLRRLFWIASILPLSAALGRAPGGQIHSGISTQQGGRAQVGQQGGQGQGGGVQVGGTPVMPGPNQRGLEQWCSNYQPGHGGTTMAQLTQLEQAERNAPNGPQAEQAMTALQEASARETIPALYRILSDPATTISYASFNDPAGAAGFDMQRGLRVLFQLEVNVAPNGMLPDRRLLSAITFWRYNAQAQRVELIGGPDAIRVRSQIVPTGGGPNLAAVTSLDVQINAQNRRVTSLASVPHYQAGAPINPLVPNPGTCLTCHFGDRDKAHPVPAPPRPLNQEPGYQDFLQHYRIPAMSQLRGQMANAAQARQLFTPAGLVNAARDACIAQARAIRGN